MPDTNYGLLKIDKIVIVVDFEWKNLNCRKKSNHIVPVCRIQIVTAWSIQDNFILDASIIHLAKSRTIKHHTLITMQNRQISKRIGFYLNYFIWSSISTEQRSQHCVDKSPTVSKVKDENLDEIKTKTKILSFDKLS